jgi:hypothetical protein
MTNWFEELPEQCPPKESLVPTGQVYYRLSKSAPPTSDDFLSFRANSPNRVFKNVSECISRSLSVWDNIDKCMNITKLPRHRGKSHVVEITLNNTDGQILKTFGENHYSWWRSTTFNLATVKVAS